MFKRLFLFIQLILSFAMPINNENAFVNNTQDNQVDLNIASEAGLLMEVTSGKILYSRNIDKKLYPASMTKMIGMYLVLESIENGIISLQDEITVSSKAASMGGTQIFLQPNEIMKVEDLLKSVAINSANDAICALAEAVSGSIEEFVVLMNKKAKEFGCMNTNFVNPTGFDDKNHYTTAYDMALIGRNLLKFGDKILRYTSKYDAYIREDTANPFWLVNTNKLVKFYEGCDGLKTGFTQDAGFCLTATAKKDNVRLLTVVMKAKDKDTRSNDTVKMLNYGFSRYESIKVFDKDTVIDNYTFTNAQNENTPLYVKEDINICGEKGIKKEDLDISYVIDKTNAPIKKDEVVGKLIIKYKDNEYNFDLYTYEDVEALDFFKVFINAWKRLLFS